MICDINYSPFNEIFIYRLLQFGVKQNPAMNALYNSQNNPKIALSTLHQQIAASLTVDVHATQVHVFKPRISTRISKYIPISKR